MRRHILLVDDSEAFRRSLGRALARDYRVTAVSGAEPAYAELSPPPDAVLLDLRLAGDDCDDQESLILLRQLKAMLPQVPVIMVTAFGDVETAVECMRLGAADFIQKGGDFRELKARIEKALEGARVSSRLRQLEEELAVSQPRELLGTSRPMREVKEMIAAVAREALISVLITGETGTGKELVARSLHMSGRRSDQPFVGVALAALPGSTVESELFGHEKGAFTDAQRLHIGLIERAHGGVLFLDEIGELSSAVQVKLLRFLEERVIHRLGGQREIPVDVQVVAATNADLASLIRRGRFRDDLYYRLKVCEIRLPAVRERDEDIGLLTEHFLVKFGQGKGITFASEAAADALTRYRWPGNVREVRNAIEAAVLKASLHHRHAIEFEDLPEEIRTAARDSAPVIPGDDEAPASLEEALARTELAHVDEALRRAGGRKSEAWKLLGLNDRFVFARRVRRLCSRYPDLAARYPAITAAFGRAENR
jgi:two-component system, NtrC family, response regulator AtoC